MKKSIRLIWKCKDCKDVVISYSQVRHDMNYCECGKSAVDLEAHYQRDLGNIKEVSRKEFIDGKWCSIVLDKPNKVTKDNL